MAIHNHSTIHEAADTGSADRPKHHPIIILCQKVPDNDTSLGLKPPVFLLSYVAPFEACLPSELLWHWSLHRR